VRNHLAGICRRDQAPRVPGDLEDHQSDEQADDRVCAWKPDGHERGARDDPERYEPVRSSVVAVSNKSGACESSPGTKPTLSREFVAHEPDHPGRGKHPQVRQVLGMNESLDRFVERDTRGHEDREHYRETCKPLNAETAQIEGDAERYGGQRIAEVVYEVGEERDRRGQREDRKLGERGDAENPEAEGDRSDSLTRPNDGTINKAVGVSVSVSVMVVRGIGHRPAEAEPEVTMRRGVWMGVAPPPVPVCVGESAHGWRLPSHSSSHRSQSCFLERGHSPLTPAIGANTAQRIALNGSLIRRVGSFMAERFHDRFPRGPADPVRLRAVLFGLQQADPFVLLASAFEQDVDIALSRVAFEEMKNEQSRPFMRLAHLHASESSSGDWERSLRILSTVRRFLTCISTSDMSARMRAKPRLALPGSIAVVPTRPCL
jgi:hypothetical protein